MIKVFVAGHKGMVGSAICRQLNNKKFDLVTADHDELDLTDQLQVRDFFEKYNFDQVYLAAGKVGGIHANNNFPAEFIYENLMIQNNVIDSAHRSGVGRLLFLGSSCIYPKLAAQPISESELLNGRLEPTNEPYAIAKIAGIKMCESYNRQYGSDFRSVMPTNLYGPGDNFHHENSHVIPALLRRLHEAKINNESSVIAWGSGKPKREFLHVDDMAKASLFVMNLINKDYKRSQSDIAMSHINIGSGLDLTIRELTETVAACVGYEGEIIWDTSKPDGAPRKLLNVEKIKDLGWSPKINLEEGLKRTYMWFLENKNNFRS